MNLRDPRLWQLVCVAVASVAWCGCTPPPRVAPAGPTTAVTDAEVGVQEEEITLTEPLSDAEPAVAADTSSSAQELAEPPAAAESAPAEPAVAEPAPTEPMPAEAAATEPAVVEPAVVEPAVVEPAVVEPAVVEPAVVEPAVVEPAVVEPAVVEPASAEPAASEAAPVEPMPTEPMLVEPAPTEAVPAEADPAAATSPSAETQLAAADPAAAAVPAAGERVITGDWPCWGGDVHRNMVNATMGISIDFEPAEKPEEGQQILWTAKLGSQTYGNAVVADGKVWVGTNNGAEYRPQHQGDRGVVLCFEEKTGKFLWQLTREKMATGRVNDWPEQGICSTPYVEGDRMWVVTNRCELMCLDTQGFLDGENDGPYTDEVDREEQDADIVWSLDMFDELGVFPHNLATSSPAVYGDLVFVVTSNGVDEAHLEIPAPRAPSFLAVNKKTGEVVWEDNTPFDQILHGQWSSPTIGIVGGQAQVYMPGGDGWLYALDAATGEHIWKFDLNPKDSKWELGGRGSRNNIIATPVFYENSVVLAVGQDPEHGEGIGHLYRIDVTKKGDVSPVTEENQPNPNSAMIWHLGGIDEDGSQTGKPGAEAFRRTLSTVAIHNGLVYAPDLSGRVHCVDFQTGRRYWEADVLAAVWSSPMVADGKVFLGDEDGIMTVFAEGKELKELKEIEFDSSIYSTLTIANGVMFLTDRSRLYAISIR